MMSPNFIVVGAAKSGTTSLYHYLKQHPQIYMSPIKETNYFSSDIDPSEFSLLYKKLYKSKRINLEKYVNSPLNREIWGAYVKKWEHYIKLFKNVKNEIAIGEVSNSYLYSKLAAKNIYERIPDTKIIMILRNPFTRAFSHYLANIRDGKAKKSFIEEIKIDQNQEIKGWGKSHLYVELGMYFQQVKRYLEIFPEHNVKIIIFEEFSCYTEKIIKDVYQFLNVDKDFEIDTKKYNAAKLPKRKNLIYTITKLGIKRPLFRLIPETYKKKVKDSFFSEEEKPELRTEEIKFLKDLYKSEIEKLPGLIKRDLSDWM